MMPTAADDTNVSPWERFYQRKLDHSKNLKAGFGEYCQCHDNASDNTLTSRTTGGLTVYDTGAKDGSWYIYNLNTERLLRRNKFTILPMPDVVISYLNNLSDAEANGGEADLNFRIGEDQRDVTDMEPEDRDDDYRDYASAVARKFITIQDHDDVYDPVMESGLEVSNVNEEVSVPAEYVERQDIQGMTTYVPRREGLRPSRAAPGTYTRREYGLHMTARQAIDKLGNAARKSVVKEIQQLLDRRSWHGVRMSNIPKEERKRIIPCKLFVKEKYSASGDFEKVKSRLVAGGHRQDARLYKDKTCSPTVATPSVFMLATIAQAESRAIATVDIPGAYLNAQMPGNVRVRMRLDASIMRLDNWTHPMHNLYAMTDLLLLNSIKHYTV